MEIEERLARARIKIQEKNSFFAYLSLFLKFKEDKNLPSYAGAGVDVKGNFSYKKEFFEKLSDDEIQGIVIHEILHLAFLHLGRLGSRNMQGWNIATDLAINTMIIRNGFRLTDGCIVADGSDEFKEFGMDIKEVSSKSAEQLYDEMKSQEQKQKEGDSGGSGKEKDSSKRAKNKDMSKYKGVDEHKYSNLTESEKKENQKEWEDKIREAYTISKMRGDTPKGIDRLIKEFSQEKINWRTILNQFISQSLPSDYTYRTPHKKSISVGEYMPNVMKEKIEVAIAIDLSGSVGQEEFSEFFSEIVGIARAYQERIDMEVYTHDTECYFSGLVRNGNIEKLKSLELKGGGGTTFQSVVDKLSEMNKKPKCLIWLTDGYAEELPKQPFPILWVLSKRGREDNLLKSGRVIKLEDVA